MPHITQVVDKTMIRKGEKFYLNPDAIFIPNENGRFKRPDHAQIKQSIATRGQESPVKVSQHEDGTLELVYGFTRVQSIKEIRQEIPEKKDLEVEVIVVKNMSKKEIAISRFTENLQRNPLTLADEAYNVRELQGHGMSDKEIAEAVGRTVSWVSQRNSFFNMSPDVQAKVESGELKLDAAILLDSVDPEYRDAVFEEAKEFYPEDSKKAGEVTATGLTNAIAKTEKKVQKKVSDRAPKVTIPLIRKTFEDYVDMRTEQDKAEGKKRKVFNTDVEQVMHLILEVLGGIEGSGPEKIEHELLAILKK